MLENILATAQFINDRTCHFAPEVAIVLGSGLGGLVKVMEVEHRIPYTEIPNFPVSTVAGHEGMLLFGRIGNRKVVAMQGRFHYYEGYSTTEITLPIRVFKYLGVEFVILSNASGGINPDFHVSDIMFIDDHINMLPNPLIGKNDDRIGPRFPEMAEPYDKRLLALADDIAAKLGIAVQHGVYISNSGPTYETPSEYQYYRVIGGDAVGMSTTPEVIVAHHCGLPVFGVSVISDLGGKGLHCQVTHEEVINAVGKAEPRLTAIISELIRRSKEIHFK